MAPRREVGLPHFGPVGQLLVGQPDLGEQLFRSLDLKGDLPQQLDPTFASSLTVEDLTRPEFWWLRRGRLFSSGAFIAAVAGQQSFASLAPINTPGLAIVERVYVGSNGGPAVSLCGLGPAVAAGTVQQVNVNDDRNGLVAQPSLLALTTGTSAAPTPPNNGISFVTPSAATVVLEGPWILTGNQNLVVLHITPNIPLTVGFKWRERAIQNNER
jgi:hypothetical protein